MKKIKIQITLINIGICIKLNETPPNDMMAFEKFYRLMFASFDPAEPTLRVGYAATQVFAEWAS